MSTVSVTNSVCKLFYSLDNITQHASLHKISWDLDNCGSIAVMEKEKNLKMVQMFTVSAHRYCLCNGQHYQEFKIDHKFSLHQKVK